MPKKIPGITIRKTRIGPNSPPPRYPGLGVKITKVPAIPGIKIRKIGPVIPTRRRRR